MATGLIGVALLAHLVAGASPQNTAGGGSAGQTAAPPGGVKESSGAAVEQPSPSRFLDNDGHPLPVEVQAELSRQIAPTPEPRGSPDAPEEAAGTSTDTQTGDNGDIRVTGRRPRGSVEGDTPPERTLGSIDIAAYGANNVGELLQALSSQTASTFGNAASPVTLLNGRRVSNFSEIAGIPAEAIERVEVFPEELAVKYGFLPTQKVVNVITLERFNARIAQVTSTVPTEGGYDLQRIEANQFTIRGATRFDIGADISRNSSLLEADRGLAQPAGIEAGGFRTLIPANTRFAVNGLVSGSPLGDVASTINARFEGSSVRGLLGPDASEGIDQKIEIGTLHLGTTQGGRLDRWSWTLTGNYDRTDAETSIEAEVAGFQGTRARSTTTSANLDVLLTGAVTRLPAGPLTTSLRLGGDLRNLRARSGRADLPDEGRLSRDRGTVQLSVDVPLANRKRRALPGLGDLSINGTIAVETLSDLQGLRTISYGANWSPVDGISVIASRTDQEIAPTLEQLGNPIVTIPNSRVFDGDRGDVDVTRLLGGNPELSVEDRHTLRLSIVARPLASVDLAFSADFLTTRIDNPILQFPLFTPDLETAFPKRFQRDGDGTLLRIDGRPLNFERADQERLRLGLSFARPLGKVEPWMRIAPVRTYSSEADARAAAAPGTIVSMVQPGSAMARRFENLTSRVYLNVFYTLALRDEFFKTADGPALDLLNGSAIDALGGARRHRVELQAGLSKKGLGGRLTATWQSGSILRGLGGENGDLRFADLATLNANFFANLEDVFRGTRHASLFKGTRVTFGITNLLNDRPFVADIAGSTPLTYQPAYLDPLGRTVSLSVRKSF